MKRLYFFIIPLLLLQSCSTMYIPATRSIPLLDKAGEFQMEVGASTNSVYANVSAAVSKDIGISINGNLSYRNFTNIYDIFTHKNAPSNATLFWNDLRGMFAHRYGEISLGKINILPSKKLKLEVFGGGGFGRATDGFKRSDITFPNNYKNDYFSIFVQSNVGVKLKVVEAGGSLRLAGSRFDYTSNEYYYEEHTFFKKKFGVFSVEPMGFVRVGKGNLKGVFRVGFNLLLPFNLNKEEYKEYKYRGFTYSGKFDYTVFHFSVGMSYRIGGNKKKDKNNVNNFTD